MKDFLSTSIASIYMGVSWIWAFMPIRSTLFLGVNQDWVLYNRELLGQMSCINLLISVCLLCLLCYNQGLRDAKNK